MLITGSSTIRLWTGIRNDLAPLEVIPRGFGGSTADDLDFYLDRLVLRSAPRAVVIYEGDHDLQVGMTPQHIADRLAQVAARIASELPSTRIYFISVKPSPKFWSLWPQARQVNELVRDLCSQLPRCTWVDTASALLASNGKFVRAYYRPDRVHLNDAGYAVWNSVLLPALMAGEAGDISLPDFRSSDIGDATIGGSAVTSAGTVTVEGSGTGTIGTRDGLHFAWKELLGNGQITARISSQSDTAAEAMAGVMLRERLTDNSRFAFVFTTPGTGTGMSYRTATGVEAAQTPPRPSVAAPHWVRLVRKWASVSCYLSANGISWTNCGKAKLTGTKQKVYIGLAVSGAVDDALGSATFDNVWIHGTLPES
ncbi:MAG: GDSL-type esterase/lipase family protein [Planctomycetaceae bacterium]